MKIIAISVMIGGLFLASCGDNNHNNDTQKKTEGSEQIQEPVLNSGPEAEQERATDAVRDSSRTIDTNEQVLPH